MPAFLLYCFVLLLSLLPANCEDDLVYVLAYSRHGARTPRLRLADWNAVPMSLTPGGMRQHYILGRELRHRYVSLSGFLSPHYDPAEISIYATNSSRCAGSAAAQALGLYPPGTGPELAAGNENGVPPNGFDYRTWVAELNSSALIHNVNVIPINTTLRETKSWRYVCPAMRKDFVPTSQPSETEMAEKYGEYMDSLASAFTHATENNSVPLGYAAALRDFLICGLYEGKYLRNHENYTRKLIQDTSVVLDLKKHVYYLNMTYNGIRMSRVVASPNMLRIKNALYMAMTEHSTSGSVSHKMDVVVLGDTSLRAIMMELTDAQLRFEIPFASVLLFELRRDSDSEYYVRLQFNDELNYTLPIYDMLSKLEGSTLPADDYTSLCNVGLEPEGFEVDWKFFALVSLLVGGGLLLALWAIYKLAMTCKLTVSEEQLKLTPHVVSP